MKANELRIGNCVMDQDESKEIFQVESIEKGEDESDGMYFINGRWDDDIDPIPITEEWLLKFGFEEDDLHWFNYGKFSIRIENKRCVSAIKDSEVWNQYDMPKYVHQLQNLYFALTGNELEIK